MMNRPPMMPPGEDFPPYGMRPPNWPPGGWGPPPPEAFRHPSHGEFGPPGGWGPPPPEGWGPPPPGGWGPPPPESWGPAPPGGWGPPPPGGWGRLPPEEWGPPGMGPRRPPPHDWGPRGPPQHWVPPHDDWLPPPDWGPAAADWRSYQDYWRHHRGLPGAVGPPGWDVPGPRGPEPLPPPAIPPPEHAAFGPVPPFGFPPTFPPVADPATAVMPNLGSDQPEWLKALIIAPPAFLLKEKSSDGKTSAPEPASSEPDPSRSSKEPVLLGKPRVAAKPPPGLFSGVILLIESNVGQIKREDQAKFTFDLKDFQGDTESLKPGVTVHFAVDSKKGYNVATDVKVAPDGTETVDLEIYEAVVSQPIPELQSGDDPGQVTVNIGPLKTNLTFLRKDSKVTLLKNDRVLINVLTDIVSDKTRATNIHPLIPSSFTFTKETRLKGVILSLKMDKGVIKSDQYSGLPFSACENFSEVGFTEEDLNEEVEFSVVTAQTGPRAVRIKRVKERILLTFCSATKELVKVTGEGRSNGTIKTCDQKLEMESKMMLDPELYEGVVVEPVVKAHKGKPAVLGKIKANIGSSRDVVTFDQHDSGVTLLRNDQVLVNLLVDATTKERRATNIRAKIPFTFNNTQETRHLGIITDLGPAEGVVSSKEHGDLSFDVCENFSDTEFSSSDVQKEVEFTLSGEKLVPVNEEEKQRAIRLRRTRMNDPKKSNQRVNVDKKKKEEVTAALKAALNKWTPIGFKFHRPNTNDDVSKDSFEGTVLRIIKDTKKEVGGAAKDQLLPLVKVKVEVDGSGNTENKMNNDAEGDEKKDVKMEQQEAKDKNCEDSSSGGELGEDAGLLVTTISSEQKQLLFGPEDLMSSATMMVGDKVKFHISTHRDSKAERATFVEILPESFQESTEERHHGIVIEFSEMSGVIKCSENPLLFFSMLEVMEKKRLQLNEKVSFSITKTPEGTDQATRVKRYVESFLHSVRKSTKEKMTFKLMKVGEESDKVQSEAEKMKAVVKSLRANREPRSPPRRRTRSRSRSSSRDKFGRVFKKRSSTSRDRSGRSRDRSHMRTRSRSRSSSRSRSREKNRSRSRSRSKNRSRSRSRSWDRSKRRSYSSQEHDGLKRRRERSPPPRGAAVVDNELVRKKRELEELNEMIAYKKSLVDFRGPDPGQKTCIDYDHGRVANPVTEYKQMRPILKRPEDHPDYRYPYPYDDPYYSHYNDPYRDPYRDSRPAYSDAPPMSHRYNDRYDVYDEPYDSQYHNPAYVDPPHHMDHRRSPERRSPVRSSQSELVIVPSTQPSRSFEPPSPRELSPRGPSPKRSLPEYEKPPLDRFLGMLGRKPAESKQEPVGQDELLPHERAVVDGQGFSRIVGLAPDESRKGMQVEGNQKLPLPGVSPSVTSEASQEEPYQKIHSLLRNIGLKLGSGELSRSKSSSLEREDQGQAIKQDENLEQQKKNLTNKIEKELHFSKPSGTPRPPPGPPPTNYDHPPVPVTWPFLGNSSSFNSQASLNTGNPFATSEIPQTSRLPPGPPPGPPPRRPEQPSVRTPPGPPPGPPPRRSSGQPPLSLHEGPSLSSPSCPPTMTTQNQANLLMKAVKSLAAQQPAKTTKSVQFNLPVQTSQISSPSSSETEDDHKTKQMSSYKTKALAKEIDFCKKLCVEGDGISAGRPGGSKKAQNVWICGHSLVYWAEAQAKSLEMGTQLGLDPSRVTVWWQGWSGMTWSKLLFQLQQLLVSWPRPQVLILHLGGNDLSTESPTNLLASVKKELMSIRNLFPDCVLVWSNILPRRTWAHSLDSHEVDLVRTTVNRRIHNIFSEISGSSLSHDNIRCGANTGLYQPDGIHLSHKGVNVFNQNLQDFLEKWEKCQSG